MADDNYRCIGCKLTFHDEPERCPECKCTAFAKIDKLPPRDRATWIQTYTGRQYWPLNPSADDVRIEDIAHHLGNICRFSGACRRYYSVAEHSVHVSHIVDAATMYGDDDNRLLVLAALLHDSEEYVPPHDVARPVKYAPECAFLREIGDRNKKAIFEALQMPDVPDPLGLIKLADNAMLLAEQETLMHAPPVDWTPVDVPDELLEMARYRMKLGNEHGVGGGAIPASAGRAFLLRYRELTAFREGVDY